MDPRRLREETRAEHEATEALMPLTGEQLTNEAYIRVLQVLFPLIASWERWCAAFAPESLRPMLEKRLRSHLLSNDLLTLGAIADTDAAHSVDWAAVVGTDAEDISRFHAGFLGVVYVLEGSTLGGRYIARQVEATLGIMPGEGNTYFQGHGQDTGSMWREITAEISAVPESLDATLLGASRRAFRAFGQALQAGQVAQSVLHG